MHKLTAKMHESKAQRQFLPERLLNFIRDATV
jgi:hypothetical protein